MTNHLGKDQILHKVTLRPQQRRAVPFRCPRRIPGLAISVMAQEGAQVWNCQTITRYPKEAILGSISLDFQNCIFCFSSLGVPGVHDPIERLKERHGKGVAEGGAVETPSKRTKKTDKSKLVRQVWVWYRHSVLVSYNFTHFVLPIDNLNGTYLFFRTLTWLGNWLPRAMLRLKISINNILPNTFIIL